MKRKPEESTDALRKSTDALRRSTETGLRSMQGQSGGEKHSLDSDEEDAEEDPSEEGRGWMEESAEGEEKETLRSDGDIAITPFNLEDEKNEGDFTTEGDFLWKKKNPDEIRDSWLDNVDWSSIKQVPKKGKETKEEKEEAYDEIQCYKDILELLRPGESIGKALRRYGGSKKKSKRPWERSKSSKKDNDTSSEGDKDTLLKLTGLADNILTQSGNMEVYEETYEGIAYKISSHSTVIPQGTNEDDALDMFASSVDAKSEANEEKKDPVLEETEVQWEFKWENTEEAEIHGPHNSKEMLEWQDNGFFEKGVFVRKVGSSGFCNSKRIDFELYT